MTSNEKDRLDRAKKEVDFLVRYWAAQGVVITLEQKPLEPLAMGHYKTVASVRLARHRPNQTRKPTPQLDLLAVGAAS